MAWVHVPRIDPATGKYNVDMYHGCYSRQSEIADMCVPGFWVEGRSTFVRLNDDIAHWLAIRLDGYKVRNEHSKKIDYHHVDQGVDVWIDDIKVAMLFKKLYGGAEVELSPV